MAMVMWRRRVEEAVQAAWATVTARVGKGHLGSDDACCSVVGIRWEVVVYRDFVRRLIG